VPGLVVLLVGLVVLAIGLGIAGAVRGHPVGAAGGVPRACALSGLPAQADAVVAEIRSGPPYPYGEDGETFDNREHRLPREPSSYYREFTVVTPGAADRGERRIIAGGPGVAPQELYYTANHYASFCRITAN
jgi:guanyl-specific ribonuclease Sa